jgi:hypothetical protein
MIREVQIKEKKRIENNVLTQIRVFNLLKSAGNICVEAEGGRPGLLLSIL